MALHPNSNDMLYSGAIGKTHTGLVVSEGAAPAEQFTVSKLNEATPFIYEYGPEGNQTIVIAKGKIVEAVGEERNPETGFKETAIKVAGEGSKRAIGVNHHNVSEQRRGRMEGNRPTVLTRSYIEVPLFEAEGETGAKTAAASAAAMHFGAAYGESGDLKSGDFVMVGQDGNFKKVPEELPENFDPRQIVGQVLNVTRDLPPAGLLQYYTGLQNEQLEDYIKGMSATPGAENSIHPYGSPYTVGSWRKDFITALGGGNLKGIPFLTDGYFSSMEQVPVTLDDKDVVEAVRPGDGVTVDATTIKVDKDVTESMVVVKLKHDIAHRELDKVKVTIGEDEVSKRDVHVDVANNSIVIYLDGDKEIAIKDLTISAPLVVNPTAGVPTEWDYKGSVGAARTLLQR